MALTGASRRHRNEHEDCKGYSLHLERVSAAHLHGVTNGVKYVKLAMLWGSPLKPTKQLPILFFFSV